MTPAREHPDLGRIRRVPNLRDLGGITTPDRRRVRELILLRSGSLGRLSAGGYSVLRSIGVKTICDLRTDNERKDDPDRIPRDTDMRMVSIPVRPKGYDDSRGLTRIIKILSGELNKIEVEEMFARIYRDFVLVHLPAFRQVLGLLQEPQNVPILIHCTAGKDRTGIACALILLVLGVSPERVVDDYMVSNRHLAGIKSKVMRSTWFLPLLGTSRRKLLPFLVARKEYLNAAFEAMNDSYGGADNYIREGLGISGREREQLKAALLCDQSDCEPPARGE